MWMLIKEVGDEYTGRRSKKKYQVWKLYVKKRGIQSKQVKKRRPKRKPSESLMQVGSRAKSRRRINGFGSGGNYG